MKNICFLLLLFIAFFASCKNDKNEFTDQSPVVPQGEMHENVIPDQYILFLRQDYIKPAHDRLDWSQISNREDKKKQMEGLNRDVLAELNKWLADAEINESQVLARYTALMAGVALKIDKETMQRLSKRPEVKSIENDRRVKLPDYTVDGKDAGDADAQEVPCGITNAGGFANAGTDRWIFIVNTGIDIDHPDLNVYDWAGISTVPNKPSVDDCNGYGTHLAGVAAAKNNTIGVVGVAAGAPVIPVWVLDCDGSGNWASILGGFEHIATLCLAGDVCTFSVVEYFGEQCANFAIPYDHILGLNNAGVRFALAAGEGTMFNLAEEWEPACLNFSRVYTVTAMTCNKQFINAYQCNFGRPPVDWVATGFNVKSTWKGGVYKVLNGGGTATGIAAAHVAGIMQIRNAAPVSGGNVTVVGENYPIARR